MRHMRPVLLTVACVFVPCVRAPERFASSDPTGPAPPLFNQPYACDRPGSAAQDYDDAACCPANYTERPYMTGEIPIAKHPPTLLLQTVRDSDADPRGSQYYFEALGAEGGQACINHSPGFNHGLQWCGVGTFLSFVFATMPPGFDLPPLAPPPPSPPPSPPQSCFAKEVGTACLVYGEATPAEAFEQCHGPASATSARLVLMKDLVPGDRVLTADEDGALAMTRVVVNQHSTRSDGAAMLTLHTANGGVSVTPTHALFVDGALVAASEATVGSSLLSASGNKPMAVTQITIAKHVDVINPVTAAGTILASDGQGPPVLAASHPIWVATLLLKDARVRTLVNAGLWAAGDVTSVTAGLLQCSAKLLATVMMAALIGKKARRSAT